MQSIQPKILIVEDEMLLAEHIKMHLSAHYDIVGIASSATEAEAILRENTPDLALLDITIKGDRDGIDLAAVINGSYQIPFIFLTSHTDRVLVERAKKVKPHAYLLKPYNEYEISIAIELALSNYEQKAAASGVEMQKTFTEEDNRVMNLKNSLFLKKDTAFQRVRIEDIVLLEADNNYTTIYTKKERFIYSTVLKKIEEKLPLSTFMRVHRSYVINVQAIEGFEGNMLHIQNKHVPVSKQHREEVFRMIQAL